MSIQDVLNLAGTLGATVKAANAKQHQKMLPLILATVRQSPTNDSALQQLPLSRLQVC